MSGHRGPGGRRGSDRSSSTSSSSSSSSSSDEAGSEADAGAAHGGHGHAGHDQRPLPPVPEGGAARAAWLLQEVGASAETLEDAQLEQALAWLGARAAADAAVRALLVAHCATALRGHSGDAGGGLWRTALAARVAALIPEDLDADTVAALETALTAPALPLQAAAWTWLAARAASPAGAATYVPLARPAAAPALCDSLCHGCGCGRGPPCRILARDVALGALRTPAWSSPNKQVRRLPPPPIPPTTRSPTPCLTPSAPLAHPLAQVVACAVQCVVRIASHCPAVVHADLLAALPWQSAPARRPLLDLLTALFAEAAATSSSPQPQSRPWTGQVSGHGCSTADPARPPP